MTTQETKETTRKILDELRNNFFNNVDIKKLMRELFPPEPITTITGIGYKEMICAINRVYSDLMEIYEKIPKDQKPDKSIYIKQAQKHLWGKGYEETSKVIVYIWQKEEAEKK